MKHLVFKKKNSSLNMSKNQEIEIIRYTLYGYIGTKLYTLNIPERQKISLNKLSFLSIQQFDNLVNDIKNEINRRISGIDNNVINHKLSKLRESKFKDLVIDVYFMYNKRYPPSTEPENFIYQFENLILSLKNSQIVKDLNSDQISFFKKLELYQKYIKQELEESKKSTFVVDLMCKIVDKQKIFFEILTDESNIIEIADVRLKDNLEYQEIRAEYENEEKYVSLSEKEDFESVQSKNMSDYENNSINIENSQNIYEHENLMKINKKKKFILRILEILLFGDTFNRETDETIFLIKNHQNVNSVNERIDTLANKLKGISDDDNFKEFETIDRYKKEERILYLAEILRKILIAKDFS